MIIVEGPDGAGKTTLCKKLSEDFVLPVMDWEQEWGLTRDEMKKDPTLRYYRSLQIEFGAAPYHSAGLGHPFIHDRFYFSSLVYGPLMEGSNQMSDEDRKTIARVLIALACPVILCLPPKEEVVKNVRGEGHQMEGVAEIIEDVYDLYSKVMSTDAFPFCMYYDYTGTMPGSGYHNYDGIKSRVKLYLDRRAQRRIV